MGFRDAVRKCLREKYFTFQGRASRSEYWYFYLFALLCWIALGAMFFLLGGMRAFDTGEFTTLNFIVGGLAVIGFIYLLIPNIAVMVRRFHDRGLSGWWVLAGQILVNVPFVGVVAGIAMLVVTVLKSKEEENRFGPNPLVEQNSADVFA